MFKRQDSSELPVETLISASTRIEGDVGFSGGLQLEGQVTGGVRAREGQPSRLVLGSGAVIEGSVTAEVVEVHGTVRGDIVAPGRVVLGPTARVEGGLQYGSIEMAAGARIDGKLVKLEKAGARA
jgi:cytoskeletal protein CcmA (bactofilin family)